MEFKNYLKVSAPQIDEELDLILAEFLNQTKKTNIKLLPLVLGFINACQGGKRIRGTLVKLGYEIATGSANPRNDIDKVAAAIEILHTAILVHDDIIDQSPTRRGQPSLYQSLGGDHYGVAQAISLGDMGLFLSLKIISEANFLGEKKLKALEYLIQTVIKTSWGQLLDVELPVSSGKRLAADTKFINLFKTAKYSIAGPLQLGAILAGADQRFLGDLGILGENLGMAFQIQDDILDGDLPAGRQETASVDEARAKALEYSLRAKKKIPKITSNGKMRKLLEQMAEYVIERHK